MLFNNYSDNFISAIGNDSTAEILNTILGTTAIKTNHIEFKQQHGQTALCFKLKGRPHEYEFKVMECNQPATL